MPHYLKRLTRLISDRSGLIRKILEDFRLVRVILLGLTKESCISMHLTCSLDKYLDLSRLRVGYIVRFTSNNVPPYYASLMEDSHL